MKYYNIDKEEVLKELNTSMEGLSSKKVIELIRDNGYNELPEKKKKSIVSMFFDEIKSPMELILLLTVILSFIIGGEVFDALVLLFIILVDVIMGTVEEYKARKDADSLLNMLKVTTKVIRDNKEIVVDSKTLVIGDIMLLESGSKVSADARIISSQNLTVDESSLTGESTEIIKNSDVILNNVALGDRTNMVYAGTSITRGRAMCVVTNTGVNTELGKIASKVTMTKEEKSPLSIRMEKFTKQIGLMIIIIALIITMILIYKNYSWSLIFLSVITLSVSAMPEGLGLALTMALTIASKRMSKKHVIVKNLSAVESLGSCTVIASDKTGTLTVNEQTLKKVILKNGECYNIGGNGYNGIGDIECVSGSIDKLKYLAYLGMINNEAYLEYENNNWVSHGDSIDIAFLSLAKKVNIEKNIDIVATIPYESENQYSAVFYKQDDDLRCTVKGSLEKVMSFSEYSDIYVKQNQDLSKDGYRVIAVCDGKVNSIDINEIKNLEYVGMAGFIDPIRDDVKDSIFECVSAGIKVIMITGDHPLTAYAIAKELNLCKEFDEVASSADLEKYRALGEQQFDEFVKNIKVFARVTPIDKLDIVDSLKRQKEFVAVTGDGVNDAPAIKSANIGISMGSGTDVAKDTASMIITNDNFTSIVEGVKEGRLAYNNIRKIILFLIGCGIAEVAFFVLSILFGYDMPMIAIQLLWLNLVTDGLQDIALSFECDTTGIMLEKPRKTTESLFSKDLIIEVLILALTITAIVFGVWMYLMNHNVDIITSRSIIMMLMVFIQNINVLNCRNEKKSIFKTSLKSNPLIILVIIGSMLLQLIISYIPFTSRIFDIRPLSIKTTIIVLLLSSIIILVFEIYKIIKKIVKN